MLLCEIFSSDLIKVGLEAENKDEVFEEMVDFFCQARNFSHRKELLAAIWDRESKMSTGIKKGIAIPHGKTDVIDHVSGVLGISKKGIEYDALDGEPVYLLFMMFAPSRDSEKHLRLLKRLAELLDMPEFYTELMAQKTPQGAYEVIKKYEERLIALT